MSTARPAVFALFAITATLLAAAPALAHSDGHRLRTIERDGRPIAELTHRDSLSHLAAGARVLAAVHATARATISQVAAPYVSDAACGPEIATDDAVDAADRVRPLYKVVYAHPADVIDGYGRYAPVIARLVADAAGAIGAASGGQLGIRLDRGTQCGPQYLDIASLALPQSADQYAGDDG